MVELIDYKYLGFTVVLLLLTYFLIAHPRHIVYEKVSSDQFNKNMVKIFTKGKIHRMDPNFLIMDLNNVKNSINQFEKSPTQTDLHKIALSEFLKNSKLNMISYITINLNKHNNIKYEEILKEKEKEKMSKKKKIELVDDDDDDEDEDDLVELENYIDIIITMIQSSMCRNGVFNFDSLIEVLNILNKINMEKTVNFTHHMGKTGSLDDEEITRRKKIMHTETSPKAFSESFETLQKNRKIRHVDGSQTQLDKTVTTGNHQKIKIHNDRRVFDKLNYTQVKTKNSPEYNFMSHSSATKFKNTTRHSGTSNKSSGSYAHNMKFINDKMIDNYRKSSLN
jgi:hypothetical protein